MDEEIENTYQWSSNYGIKVISVNLQADYDGPTLEVLEEARKADQEIRRAARMGQAYSSNMAGMMAAASGEAMKTAAGNENGAMMGFMNMNMASQNGANLMGAVNNVSTGTSTATPVEDPTEKLLNAKKLLDAGAITSEDYDKLKAQILGI